MFIFLILTFYYISNMFNAELAAEYVYSVVIVILH